MSTPEIRAYQATDDVEVERCIFELQEFEHDIDVRVLPGEAVGGWYLKRMLSDCAQRSGRILVAEIAGRVVGFVAVQAKVPCEDQDEAPYEFAYISDLGVLADFRGRGIGRALMAAAEAFALDEGARWLRIAVLAENEGAWRLYRSRGFADRQVVLEKALAAPDGG